MSGGDKPLGASLARLEAMLIAANGRFVQGRELALACHVPMSILSNFVKQLRKERPGLVIQGKQGSGYRLVVAQPAEDAPVPRPEFDPPRKPREPNLARKPRAGGGRSYRAAHVDPASLVGLLNKLTPHSAEIVKVIALESGEGADETLARLIAYGCEVHRDLVAGGENPLGLKAPRS